MSARQKNTSFGEMPLVVGTIHSRGSLRKALKLRRGDVDLFELRVDHFARDPEPLLEAGAELCAPAIVTVRHGAEGGAERLPRGQREELFTRFLPVAAFVDLELRSVEALAPTVAAARAAKVKLIVSDHHFRSTPALASLRKRLRRARAAGADIVKVAALASSPADLARLLALFCGKDRPALSVMGMGPLGKVSRLLFACTGSVLNYGYLDQPQLPGQWEARELKARLLELRIGFRS
jgi:3-dehydroquinate dehydratase-1